MTKPYRLLREGERVHRGPAWHWNNQDCDSRGHRVKGTVTRDQKHKGDVWVYVRWDGGMENCYEYEPSFRAIERVNTDFYGQLDLFEEA